MNPALLTLVIVASVVAADIFLIRWMMFVSGHRRRLDALVPAPQHQGGAEPPSLLAA